ncbi:DUF1093 domain-containing protein [Leuconostoc mesenteroides]|uniref:DUF1093 domain-containing protein n=1 Tax=Leuconostoc mesenteroides TaxID=1245 RepID=UPI00235FA1A8|nr:DUF1093 domain-containing protein [Leuconostoc mesenteroides]
MNLNRRKSIILVSIILVLLAIFFVQAARYYHDTYVTVVGYAKAPAHVPKKEKTTDDNGKVIAHSHSYIYKFHFVTKKGERKTLNYELSGENVRPLKKNSFVKADISDKRVVEGPYIISKSTIPDNIIYKLK